MPRSTSPFLTLSALVASGFLLSACGKPEAPAQTAAAPAQPAMTAGQRMQERRAQAAQKQIEDQMQAQIEIVPAEKDERKQ